jgi:hypothetical protein
MNITRDPFEITFEINNKGNINLKGCYFLSIKTNKKYLTCRKHIIKDDIKKDQKKRMNLEIDFNEDGDEDNQDIYEGYFRLFTDEGIPFGDILYLQVVVDD